MSSPPPPQNPTNPLKRPSLSSSTSQPLAPSSKRPRTHPLRQTSFPSTAGAGADPDSGYQYQYQSQPQSQGHPFSAASDGGGSVTGSFTGSLGGASADGIFASNAVRAKKRGRKSKAEKEREREEGSSVRGGLETRMGSVEGDIAAGGGGSVKGGGGAGGQGDEEGEDEDFDDEGELLGREEGVTDVEAEKKNLALLVDAFNPMQSERYDLFKRTKLRKESLRRIVNHALSQSVPAGVVTTVNGFTKVFVGEMVEKARTVQTEWADAHDQAALATFKAEEREAEAAENVKRESSEGDQAQPAPRAKREFKPPPNPHRGQLLPAHLREAQRRHKRDCEGGNVGFAGLSMGNLGTRGPFVWNSGSVGGRRLFR